MSKGNRTKSGVKSASSQMAADLLSGGGMVTFDAFAGGCASMVETEDTISLKKLAKRDSSTREKALRELLERCTQDNVDTVVSTFSNFAAQFDKIIFDCSPTVRQLAMKLVSKQVNLLKKKAEKDLFNILPWIVFASCDPYNPCASEAANFLSGMFSKEKWEEILKKLSGSILAMAGEILSGQSNLLNPSKLMKNDEEDSREERVGRLSEQSYGVIVNFLTGEKREEAEQILLRKLKTIKSNELTRGLLNAVSNCVDPVAVISACSLFDQMMAVFASADQCSLLPLSTDLLLRLLSSTSVPLNDKQKKKVVNTLLLFIKKCGVREWDSLGIRLLPLFSSLCALMDESSRSQFITNWFAAMQANGIPTKECILYVGDCVKYVLALLSNPSPDETSTALSMIFFLVSQSSSADPSTLQSLIIWSLPRLAEAKVRFFLEEVLRRCRENMPSSRPLLCSLLSLHSDHLLFGWEYLAQSGDEALPIKLLCDAPDAHLVSLNESIGLLNRVIESGDASLGPLYSRLSALLPSTALDRDTPLPYSPLISSLLTTVGDDEVKRILRELKEEDRLKCVEEWTKEERSQPIIRLHRLQGEKEKSEMESKLRSLPSSLEFLATVASSCEFSSEFGREVGVRVVRGYVAQALNETKAVYLSGCARSLVHRLDVSSTLKLITNEVMESSAPIEVASFRSMATLFYDLIDNGVNLLDESAFFAYLTSILAPLADHLTHYALLSHFWPCSIDKLPYRSADSGDLIKLIDGVDKALALFLALYVHRVGDAHSGTLLLPVLIFSSVIRLARLSPLSCLPQSETEERLLQYAQEMIESGGSEVQPAEVLSLLSHCSSSSSSSSSRPLLLYSLRQLTACQLALPIEADTPFGPLPTQGFNQHLEMARQLYHRRNVHTVMEMMTREQQKEEETQLFTMLCDDAHFSLSVSALTGANEYLSREEGEEAEEKPLSDSALDFLRCAIVTAVNSVHSDCVPSDAKKKWEEGRRRILAAAAIQLAIRMNTSGAEEWIDFFLPSITPILLVMYGEMDMLDGSSLARSLSLFLSSHPSLTWEEEWSGHWDKSNARFDMEMDAAGIHKGIQTIVLRASSVLSGARDFDAEAIVAASRIIGMCASATISFSAQDGEKGVTVVLPPFLKNMAEQDGWSRCGVLVGCLSLLSSSAEGGENTVEKKEESTVERSVLCDALSPTVSKCLTTIVSKTEQKDDRIQSRFFTEKAVPGAEYLLHWSCHLLRETLSAFPAIVKMWYTGLPKSAGSLVNRFISSHLSPILIDHELTQVMEGNLTEKHKNDQATLTIRRHSNEILLNYILEDTRMRLYIKMPLGWPLLPPAVSVEGSIVGEQDGRKWMLQLNSQLHRNASLLSALSAWLVHAGKKVEGADSCTICMMLVAPQTKQLPKARCRTCHNKFHSSCLYKWFESSNQSSCPLCRTDFTAPP